MTTTTIPSGRIPTAFGPKFVDRRTRTRLRELCDEVLASYRAATNRDLFSERDREEARTLLSRLLPSAAKKNPARGA